MPHPATPPAPQVAHLHVHSEYSLLDGTAKVRDIVRRAAELGQPALGLTDHGVMSGSVELQKACDEEGIKPVFGCEVYLVEDRLARPEAPSERNHLTLLAETDAGYRNLMKISSAGFLGGFQDGKPAIDLEVLARHNEGIIALTGCLSSHFVRRILEGDLDAARKHADELIDIFGADDVYFEVQENTLANQDRANPLIAKLATEFGRPLVATADVHYLREKDFHAHQAMLCVQTNSTLAEPALSFDANEFWLKSNEEMAAAFAGKWPGALLSTIEIAERAQARIPLGDRRCPKFPSPGGKSDGAYLYELVFEGLARRYGSPIPAAVVERAENELSTIDQLGSNSYFLILWDLVKYAKANGISVGPGRGATAGSIVAYALGITAVDPIAHDLLFERFLNAERVSLPDIDIDFSVDGRTQLLDHLAATYGSESVSRIVTFGRVSPRAALRDAASVLGHDAEQGKQLSRLIPDPEFGRPPKLEDCLREGQPLAAAYASDASTKEIVDLAIGFEGVVSNGSVHAAAVAISDGPMTDFAPVQMANDDDPTKVTQFSMNPVEELGILKLDLLGLRALDTIDRALESIERNGRDRPDLEALPLDDAKTFEMLAAADTRGVFLFESEGMRDALKVVRPSTFEDLVALIALYRPGAMRYIPIYAERKRGEKPVRYLDPRLEPILAETLGLPIYQEQGMRIAQVFADFSGEQADALRRVLGKKDREKTTLLREQFYDGCRRSGTAEETIDQLWQMLADATDWSFNKAHAVSYGLIAYRMAWLKAHFGVEYLGAACAERGW